MNNTDIEKLKKAVKHFKFASTPSNGSPSEPCTNADLKKLINETSKLFSAFIDVLENN